MDHLKKFEGFSKSNSNVDIKVSEADKIKSLPGFNLFRTYSSVHGYSVTGRRSELPMESLTISKNNVFDKDTLFPYSELSNNLPNSSFKDEKVLATCIDLHSLPVDHPMRMFLLNSNQKSSASSESSSELSSSLFPTSEEIVETFKDLML